MSGGIAHAFNGSDVQAQAFVQMGFKLGFGGAVTFERALQLRRLAQSLPLDALVMETDAPDIAPHWLYATAAQRGAGQAQGRNEPCELPRMGAVVAQLRGMSVEALELAAREVEGEAVEAIFHLVPEGGAAEGLDFEELEERADAAGAIRAELAVILRLHFAAVDLFDVAARFHPFGARAGEAGVDVDGGVGIGVDAARIVDGDGRFIGGRVHRDFAERDADVGMRAAGCVDFARADERASCD